MKNPPDDGDGDVGSQPKRHTLSPGHLQTDTVPEATAGRVLQRQIRNFMPAMKDHTNEKINEFVMLVKDTLKDNREMFDEFAGVMGDYCRRRIISLDVLITRVRELFKEHPELVAGFNSFLLKRYCIVREKTVVEEKTIDFEGALELVSRIKNRFHIIHGPYHPS